MIKLKNAFLVEIKFGQSTVRKYFTLGWNILYACAIYCYMEFEFISKNKQRFE